MRDVHALRYIFEAITLSINNKYFQRTKTKEKITCDESAAVERGKLKCGYRHTMTTGCEMYLVLTSAQKSVFPGQTGRLFHLQNLLTFYLDFEKLMTSLKAHMTPPLLTICICLLCYICLMPST